MALMNIIVAALLLSIVQASPAHIVKNIQHLIIDPSDSGTFLSENHPLARQAAPGTFPATKKTASGISRSRLGFLRIARGGGGVSLPGIPGIKFKGSVSGSVTFKGYMAKSVDTALNELVRTYDNEFRSKYVNERKKLSARAKKNFFWFFQAAANYGYTKNSATRDFVNSGEFEEFSERTKRMMSENEQTEVEAKFEGSFEGVTTGVPGVAQWFGYIVVNQITLDSGKIFNVVKSNPELTVADQRGNVLGEQPSGASVKPKNINDSVIDVTLAG